MGRLSLWRRSRRCRWGWKCRCMCTCRWGCPGGAGAGVGVGVCMCIDRCMLSLGCRCRCQVQMSGAGVQYNVMPQCMHHTFVQCRPEGPCNVARALRRSATAVVALTEGLTLATAATCTPRRTLEDSGPLAGLQTHVFHHQLDMTCALLCVHTHNSLSLRRLRL